MKWQMMNSGVPTGDVFDDGLPYGAGDEEFTISDVELHAELNNFDGFNYMGKSDSPIEAV